MIQTRRKFTQLITLLGATTLFSVGRVEPSTLETRRHWFMPEESDGHKRTWMAFIASEYIWAEKQVSEVHRNLASIAKTIAKYEPVSLLVRKQDYNIAANLLAERETDSHPIELIEFNMNDLWMRDAGPAFVINGQGQKIVVNFGFNGWGGSDL